MQLLYSSLSAQRKTVHTDWGEAVQRIQEGWEYLQTADAGGQRGGQQHLEWKLHPADVGLWSELCCKYSCSLPCVLCLCAHMGVGITLFKISCLWLFPG